MRRIHPRHTTEKVVVRPYSEDPETWVGTYGAAVTYRAQVEHSRELAVLDDGVRAVSVLTVRIPPAPDGSGPGVDDVPAGSEVVHAGSTSWALVSRPVVRHGALVYLELTTGDRPPRAKGGVEVVAVLHRTGGFDRDGSRLPSEDVPVPSSVFVPGATSEPVDDSQETATTGTWLVPASLVVVSTDRVTISAPATVAGSWQVDGDPSPDGDHRLSVPLRRL